MSSERFGGPLRVYAGECRGCGLEIERTKRDDKNGGNTHGIHFKCPDCGTSNWLKHKTSGSPGSEGGASA